MAKNDPTLCALCSSHPDKASGYELNANTEGFRKSRGVKTHEVRIINCHTRGTLEKAINGKNIGTINPG